MPTSGKELSEEIQARHEADAWDLRKCPCCGYKATVHERENSVQILCARWGCRQVEAATLADAAYLWNQPRFSDGPQSP